jgi:hypothetical protein
VRLRTMVYRLRYLRAANRWALAAVRLAEAVECGVLKQMDAYRVLMREPMPDTDLPTLQQRVARVMQRAQKTYDLRGWPAERIAAALHCFHADFANDDETEIAHAASAWLRKVNR